MCCHNRRAMSALASQIGARISSTSMLVTADDQALNPDPGSASLWSLSCGVDYLGALAAREIDTAVDMAIHCDMAIMTIKSTYSLDVESVRVLEALAQRWDVSKSEVLRRAIRIAATGGKTRRGCVPRHPRPIANFPARAQCRCLPMGRGSEGRTP